MKTPHRRPRSLASLNPSALEDEYDRVHATVRNPDAMELGCYDVATGTLSTGMQVELVAIVDPSTAIVRHQGFQFTVPTCSTVFDPRSASAPAAAPLTCCYDVAAGRLRCDDPAIEGLALSLIAMASAPDGSIVAVLDGPDLPDNLRTVPICDDNVSGCCFDGANEVLVCPGTDLDGQPAAIVAAWEAEGQVFVWATWPGGGGRMPMCVGAMECPPVFCCLNLQDFTYVCPGRPELNGQPAPVVDVVLDGGYSWAVLDDDTKLPLCGKDCPPPEACPSCEGAPRGQWMSADGSFHHDEDGHDHTPDDHEHGCPTCPEGMLLDTQRGLCVPISQMPPIEQCKPWWELKGHCCESCAHGGSCDGDSCGVEAQPNPCGCAAPAQREENPRKRNVTIPPGTSYATDPGCPSGQVYCGSTNENDPPICCDPMIVPAGHRVLSAAEARARIARSRMMRIKTKFFRRNR